jgi:site-specific DNA recombinase
MADPVARRCAIYTRKSSEEGLEQDYNSLDAQREACEAFVRSQSGEGWRLSKTRYDDGGFSGGTMERPALQQLLAHIREGLLDTVVVYKVDRLTRSLADFARIVELFDAHHVSFVAVTQQFNTTTSMGRLTLNVLLSFAQFEREVIGERIRDKVAGSKRKGMWMGGTTPMGYDVRERKLVVNQHEADIVRHIYECYLALGSVRQLKKELDERGVGSAIKVTRKGTPRGGKRFSRGALYCLLANPVYVGRIRHKGVQHPGQHEAIVSDELWNQVQERLRNHAMRHGEGHKTEALRSPLAGKLFDKNGEPLYVQGAANGQRRYRYYVSRHVVCGETVDAEHVWRIGAPELEQAIARAAQEMLGDRAAIAKAADEGGTDAGQLPSTLKSAQVSIEQLRNENTVAEVLAELAERVELHDKGIRISLHLPLTANEKPGRSLSARLHLSRFVPLQMKRRGVETRLVLEGDSGPRRIDLPLLKAVARSRKWAGDLVAGRVPSVRELARQEKMDARSLRRLLPLGFLSPRIVEAITEGRQPPELTVTDLTLRIELPLVWSAQEQTFAIRHFDRL